MNRNRRRRRLTLGLEGLEPRCLLAADWVNPALPGDVNDDGWLTAGDVLAQVNELNAPRLIDAAGRLPARTDWFDAPLFDTDGDDRLFPRDVLRNINAINLGIVQPIVGAESSMLPDLAVKLLANAGVAIVGRTGADLVVRQGAVVLFTQPENMVGSLTLTGEVNTSDVVEIDFTSGNPIPVSGLIFDGGAGTGIDDLTIRAAGQTTRIAYNGADREMGQVLVGGRAIAYREVEPTTLTVLGAADLTLEFAGGDANIEFTAKDALQSVVTGASFVNTVFDNPANSLTVRFTDANPYSARFTDLADNFNPANGMLIEDTGGGADAIQIVDLGDKFGHANTGGLTIRLGNGADAANFDANAQSFATLSVAAESIAQTAALSVSGLTTLDVSVAQDLLLPLVANDFSTVSVVAAKNATILDATGIDFNASTVAGTLNVTATGPITDSGPLAIAGATTLASGNNPITLDTATNDLGSSITATSTANITLIDANGATAVNVNAFAANIIFLSGGPVTDADAADDFIATNLLMSATGGLGTAVNRIHTNVAGLDVANATSGAIYLTDTAGGLTLADQNADTLAVSGVGGGGAIRANSPLAINSNATTTGGFSYAAADSAAAGDNLTIAAGVTVRDTTAGLIFQAGDDFVLPLTATIQAVATVAITGDFGNADAGVGSTITLSGTITAASATIGGDTDADTLFVTPSATTPITIAAQAPAVAPGDRLDLNLAGVTSPTVFVEGLGATTLQSTNRANVSATGIETFNTTGGTYALAVDATRVGVANSGTADEFLFALDPTRTFLQASVNGTLLFTDEFASINGVVVTGSNDDDTLRMNNANGLLNRTTTYNAGAGSDRLIITGDPAAPTTPVARETYLAGATDAAGHAGTWVLDPNGSAGAGLLGLFDGDELRVNFTGINPADTSTPAVIFDIVLPATADNLTIENGGLLDGVNAARVLDNGNTFETFRFANKTTVRIHGADGTDTLTVDHSTAAAGLATLELYGHDATGSDPTDDGTTDTFQVRATAAAYATIIHGSNGDDAIHVSSDAPANLGTVDGIAGTVTIHGDAGTDALTVSDAGDATADNGTLSATQITGLGNTGAIDYATLESLLLSLGSGGDTLLIASTHAGTTTVNGNAGGDVFNVQSGGGPTTVNGGIGDEIFQVSSDAPTNTGLLDGILQTLTLNGDAGSDALAVSDAGDATGDSGTLSATQITGLGNTGAINYATMESMQLDLGSGGDTLLVTSTHGGSSTVNANAGGDTLNTQSTGGITALHGNGGNDSFNVSSDAPLNAGDLNGIAAGFTVTGDDHDLLATRDVENQGTIQPTMPYSESSIIVEAPAQTRPVGDTLNLSEAGLAAAVNYSVNFALAARVGGPTVGYSGMELWSLTTGVGSNLLTVTLPEAGDPSLPDVITFDGNGPNVAGDVNRVEVDGSSQNDRVKVKNLLPVPAGARGTIEVADVRCLNMHGDAGNDTMIHNADVFSVIEGNSENDILMGGSAINFFDVLLGGSGVDALFAQNGDDWLFSDRDILDVQSIQNGEIIDGGAEQTLVPGDSAEQVGGDFVRNIESLKDGGAKKDVLTWLRARFVGVTVAEARAALAIRGC